MHVLLDKKYALPYRVIDALVGVNRVKCADFKAQSAKASGALLFGNVVYHAWNPAG